MSESAVPVSEVYGAAAELPVNGRLRMSLWARFWAAGISLACLSLLIVAARLSPNPGGIGTHQRLGLPECGFLERTGIPCPSCGMTTSFSWFVRGNILASIYVQPMGAALALLCGMTFWVAGYIAVSGRPIHRLLHGVPVKYHLIPLLSLAILAWGWKIFIHLHGIDGWK